MLAMKQKILLVTSKILGSGHYNAAQNLYKGILNIREDINIELYDWNFFGGKAYEFMLQNAPKFWGLLNETMQNDLILGFSKIRTTFNNLSEITKEALNKELWWKIRYSLLDLESFIRFNKFIEAANLFRDKKPKWSLFSKIILTLPGAQYLGYSNIFSEKTLVLVTDYGKVDKVWTVYTPSVFFVANQITKDYLESFKHLHKSKIVHSGIPVNPLTQVLNKVDKIDLRRKLGIKSDRFYIISGGGAGGRNISDMFDEILKLEFKNTEFLVVCGRNKELLKTLKNKLKKHSKTNIKLMGYVENDNLLRLYRAADMVITKPGGITTTELINLNTPIGVYYYHPQELGNLEHIKYNRLGLINENCKEFLTELMYLDDDDFEYFSRKMKKVAKYDSIEIINQYL